MITHVKEEWKEHYINYNFMKKKIKTLWEMQKNEKDSPNLKDSVKLFKPGPTVEVSPMDTFNKNDPIEKILLSSMGKYINEFLTIIDNEIKKFYSFFHKIEKDLYVEINSHLYMEENYKTFSLNHIFDELEKLEEMCKNTLNISDYVNINITGIRKILKKFDKKFKLKDNPIALYYLRKNLKSTNSNLAYILQFKIIDESSALLEKLIISLEKNYSEKISTINSKEVIEDLLHEPLIMKEMNLNVISELNESKVTKLVFSKFKNLKSLIEKIDDNNNLIRTNLEIWTLIIKSNIKMIDDFYSKRGDIEEQILSKLTPQLKSLNQLASENVMNIWLALIHTFIYTMNCYIMQPTNNSYIKSMESSPFLSGLIMGFTPLAALLSTFIYSYWSFYSYKIPLIFSCFCFIIGNFLYSFADYKSSLIIMGLGRFFIGFGGARVINRRYLIDHVNQEFILYYSFMYVIMTCLGMAAAPLFALILLQFPNSTYLEIFSFNTHTYPGWFCFYIWIAFIFFIVLLFNDEISTKVVVSTQADIVVSKQSNARLDVISEEKEGESVSLVNKEIKELLDDQNKAFSYLSISFTILISILFVARMYTECLLILAPITLPYDYGWSYTKLDIFFCLTALLVLPMCVIFDRFSKNYKERQLLIVLLVISFFCCVIMLRYFWEVSVIKYIAIYTLLSLTTNTLESVGSALIANISIGGDMNTIFNSGFIIVIAVTGGRWIGSNLVTIFGYYDYSKIQDIAFIFFSTCFAILSVIVYINYEKLRVKAIARIKRNTIVTRFQFS